MAAACLREDRWLVHHLATDLPISEVQRLALDAKARLIVFSTTTPDAGRRAGQAATEISVAHPELAVIVGRPGDSLRQLRQLARDLRAVSAGQGSERDGRDRYPSGQPVPPEE
jgi:hypothetical protein